MRVMSGGLNYYGLTLGILMMDTRFPRIPGDIGNAATFPFPVQYRVVKGATGQRLVVERDQSLLQPFIQAGQELCATGSKVLTTSCGFLAMFHRELTRALPVPVFTSSLLQIPLVHTVTGGRRVGVLTAKAGGLTDLHFESVGAAGIPMAIEGLEHTHFGGVLNGDLNRLDIDQAEEDMVSAARRLVEKHPDIGAVVLECTNMPPFAKSVQRAVGLPVFDIITLVTLAYEALNRKDYSGYFSKVPESSTQQLGS